MEDFICVLHILDYRNNHRLGKTLAELTTNFQLRDSDILLLASWNNINENGIITGKIYEYFMMNKPILCTVTGNLPNSAIKEMIETANNGIVWEQITDNKDYPLLKSYIKEQYYRYKNNNPMLFEPNEKFVEQFNYTNLAERFAKLINLDK